MAGRGPPAHSGPLFSAQTPYRQIEAQPVTQALSLILIGWAAAATVMLVLAAMVAADGQSAADDADPGCGHRDAIAAHGGAVGWRDARGRERIARRVFVSRALRRGRESRRRGRGAYAGSGRRDGCSGALSARPDLMHAVHTRARLTVPLSSTLTR